MRLSSMKAAHVAAAWSRVQEIRGYPCRLIRDFISFLMAYTIRRRTAPGCLRHQSDFRPAAKYTCALSSSAPADETSYSCGPQSPTLVLFGHRNDSGDVPTFSMHCTARTGTDRKIVCSSCDFG